MTPPELVLTRTWENGLVEDYTPGGTAAAVFSADRVYRYLLRRTWEPALEPLLFIMLNPSTADAATDDQTIRRCVWYARRGEYGGLTVANLFGLRSTDPRALLTHPDPIGDDNLRVLTTLALRDPGRTIIAAWGAHDPRLHPNAELIEDLFTVRGHTLHRLGVATSDGHPRHPSRLANDVPIEVHRPGKAIVERDPLAELFVPHGLEPCRSAGMCPRLVTVGVRYCCGPCGDGWEATPRYEPDHTEACDARWAERQGMIADGT